MIYIAEALAKLAPKAKFAVVDNDINRIDWQSNDIEQPSNKAIQAKLKELQAEYEAKQYQRDRAEAYDPIPEQLDQIYHDMDGWKQRIKAVKDKYPKP
tara:strand:+ start:5110 stop:5403 length:294 start_codon:yes stop_codon:yes gene_type:complete